MTTDDDLGKTNLTSKRFEKEINVARIPTYLEIEFPEFGDITVSSQRVVEASGSSWGMPAIHAASVVLKDKDYGERVKQFDGIAGCIFSPETE